MKRRWISAIAAAFLFPSALLLASDNGNRENTFNQPTQTTGGSTTGGTTAGGTTSGGTTTDRKSVV